MMPILLLEALEPVELADDSSGLTTSLCGYAAVLPGATKASQTPNTPGRGRGRSKDLFSSMSDEFR